MGGGTKTNSPHMQLGFSVRWCSFFCLISVLSFWSHASSVSACPASGETTTLNPKPKKPEKNLSKAFQDPAKPLEAPIKKKAREKRGIPAWVTTATARDHT